MSYPSEFIAILSRQAISSGSIYPTGHGHPYYIVAPRYVRTSAGVRSIHLLAHWLNVTGSRAYLYFPLEWNDESLGANGDLCTPDLNQHIVEYHYARKLTPIVVCLETYLGTLPNAPFTVRYFGNYLGLLGEAKSIDPSELPFGYSTRLAQAVGVPDNVLTIPVLDTATFKPGPAAVREGSCYYAQKFKKVHGGKVKGVPRDAIEITRDEPGQQTPQEIADLFRRSEVFYCFEDSALMLEAGLCGCPTILMPNEYFENPLGVLDFGWDGFAWGDSPEEVARARATVQKVTGNYRVVMERFFVQLDAFVAKTQAAVASMPYPRRIELPKPTEEQRLFRLIRATGGRLLDRYLGRGLAWTLTRPIGLMLDGLERLMSPPRDRKEQGRTAGGARPSASGTPLGVTASDARGNGMDAEPVQTKRPVGASRKDVPLTQQSMANRE